MDKGKSVENEQTQCKRGKRVVPTNALTFSRLRHLGANVLARWLGSGVRGGSGVVVSVRGGTLKPCKNHHAHNPAGSSGSACHVVSTFDGGRHSGQDLVLVVVGVLQ